MMKIESNVCRDAMHNHQNVRHMTSSQNNLFSVPIWYKSTGGEVFLLTVSVLAVIPQYGGRGYIATNPSVGILQS